MQLRKPYLSCFLHTLIIRDVGQKFKTAMSAYIYIFLNLQRPSVLINDKSLCSWAEVKQKTLPDYKVMSLTNILHQEIFPWISTIQWIYLVVSHIKPCQLTSCKCSMELRMLGNVVWTTPNWSSVKEAWTRYDSAAGWMHEKTMNMLD